MKQLFFGISLILSLVTREAFAFEFKKVCDRSGTVRSFLETHFSRHCSEISQGDLEALSDTKLFIFFGQDAERVEAGDFSGIKASVLKLNITNFANKNSQPLRIVPGAFDGSEFKHIAISEYPTLGEAHRPVLEIAGRTFAGLTLDSLSLINLNLAVRDGAFSDLTVGQLSISSCQSALGIQGFMNLDGSPFAGTFAKDVELSFSFAQTKWLLGPDLFSGLKANSLKLRGFMRARRLDIEAFNSMDVPWVQLADLWFDDEAQHQIITRYPKIRFSF